MKSPAVTKLIAFLLGAFVGGVCCILSISRLSGAGCEQEVDLALGRTALNTVPLLYKISQLSQSNQLKESQRLLRSHVWWQLELAWAINKQYHGRLDGKLRPVLINIYPELRGQAEADLKSFNWPNASLAEMSNFMKETDAMLATGGLRGAKSLSQNGWLFDMMSTNRTTRGQIYPFSISKGR
jgi:hypothetical protein